MHKYTVKIDGLTADSSNSYGGLDGNGDSVDYFDPLLFLEVRVVARFEGKGPSGKTW